jgi:crossover junction endodeoxyribonuclease RusA
MTLRFALPYPPSVNHYWQHIVLGGKFKKSRVMVFLSEAGKRYRKEAVAALAQQQVPRGALKGRLDIHVVAYPPDRRGKRDLDNLWKGMLDSLVHAGVIADDGDFDRESIERGPVRQGGHLELVISERGEYHEQATLTLAEPVTLDRHSTVPKLNPDPF